LTQYKGEYSTKHTLGFTQNKVPKSSCILLMLYTTSMNTSEMQMITEFVDVPTTTNIVHIHQLRPTNNSLMRMLLATTNIHQFLVRIRHYGTERENLISLPVTSHTKCISKAESINGGILPKRCLILQELLTLIQVMQKNAFTTTDGFLTHTP
jgi:hypothetical protein